MESKQISTIKGYKKNPRKITERMFNLLGETIQEFGDLSGIVVNIRTNEAVGGNQRTSFFKQHEEDCEIQITERLKAPTPQGTVATGYVVYKGEKYAYREVDWDAQISDRANIAANKIGGTFDFDILANEFEIDDLKYAGFSDLELPSLDGSVEEVNNDPTKEWEGMPDYDNKERGYKTIVVHFQYPENVEDFAKKIGQDVTDRTKYIWYPERESEKLKDYGFNTEVDED